MELVVNEWLPEYFKPDATQEEKQLLQLFLQKFLQKNDTIVVRKPSPFLKKIDKYAKDYQTNQKVYQHLKNFIQLILKDSNRCIFVNDENEFAISNSAKEKLQQGNYNSDEYLFEAALFADSKIIVTTDIRLVDQMKDQEQFKVMPLKVFLENY
jgi:predicted nucleic acid-binding protein